MAKKLSTALFVFALAVLFANTASAIDTLSKVDSIEKSFKYTHGIIRMRNGIGTITIPKGFKYLDAAQSEKVLTEIWGNPKSENITLGMILPEQQGVLDEKGYVFKIQYDEIGYVEDKDADDINYDDLLTELKKDTEEENAERQKEGYPAIDFVGWASKPYYDKQHNILHWAKELKFGDSGVNTLNYNVRVLGRKGVLVLNAIATVNDLPLVKADIPKVINIVDFADGYKYSDFDPGVDKVAAWTIGGLVAGKILAKAGFFVVLLKFWKLIAVAVVAAFGAVKRFFTGKKSKQNIEPVEDTAPETENETTSDVVAETTETTGDGEAPKEEKV